MNNDGLSTKSTAITFMIRLRRIHLRIGRSNLRFLQHKMLPWATIDWPLVKLPNLEVKQILFLGKTVGRSLLQIPWKRCKKLTFPISNLEETIYTHHQTTPTHKKAHMLVSSELSTTTAHALMWLLLPNKSRTMKTNTLSENGIQRSRRCHMALVPISIRMLKTLVTSACLPLNS